MNTFGNWLISGAIAAKLDTSYHNNYTPF